MSRSRSSALDLTTDDDSGKLVRIVVVNSDRAAADWIYWKLAHTFRIVVIVL